MGDGRLEGKRTVVTGGGSGIGRATALRFAQEGARVSVIDLDQDAVRETAAEIVGGGGLARATAADVTLEEEIQVAIADTAAEWDGLDVVVANAAVQLFGEDDRADRLALEVWSRTLAVNLTGVFLTCKHGIRALLDSGGGSVVCTGSPTGLFGLAPGFDAYSASKAGVHGLARVLAIDYAAEGIRVNAVVPGFTETPLVRRMTGSEREALLDRIPLGRPGSPQEVASMILFLASDDSAYATGGLFCVDGGLTAV
jgi:NAD(P)-dependent dehydrogenase (short-subunit alcohol dehydrogenase family)